MYKKDLHNNTSTYENYNTKLLEIRKTFQN